MIIRIKLMLKLLSTFYSRSFASVLASLLLPLAMHAQFNANDLAGDWLVSEKTAVITFFRDGDKFFGTTSWMQRPKDENGKLRTDIHNPDPARRSQPLLGALLCKNFVYDGDGVWVDGTVYDSRSGKTYNAKITMKDHNTIVLRGYIGISLIGASTTWTRKEK